MQKVFDVLPDPERFSNQFVAVVRAQHGGIVARRATC